MQYGHFDDSHREYIITRPDTPKSWSNYLGNTEYGAIITNNAGGYSFYKSGGQGRFMRMRFNSVPMDQPGRYIYFHDHEDQDYWSASWQPVGKNLEEFHSECRHGTAYTIISSKYRNIASEATFYVPLGKKHEVWRVRVTNRGSNRRKLSAFSYVEYAANWNAIDDLLNIQYVQYTPLMKVVDNIIDHGTNVFIPEMPDNFKEKDQGRHTFQAMVGLPITGYDTDRDTFLGPYRTYANPIAVSSGKCANSLGYGDDPCGSLQGTFELEPGETKEFVILVGIGKAEKEGKEVVSHYQDFTQVEKELDELKKFWHSRMAGLTAETPDSELNSTINTWGIYNSLITFAWSRAASLIYSGIDRDGLGYRDTVQDFLGVMHTIPEEARERLELMITGQMSSGGAKPVVYPISHHPGKEIPTREEEYRSDDCMWLFNAVPSYVKETGNIEFYNKVLPYADKGEDTVFNHLKRAIEFNLERSGENGLPCGLMADWNDSFKLGHDGESIFVAFQLRYALKTYIEIAGILKDSKAEKWAQPILMDLDQSLQKNAWDGEWYLRGIRKDGFTFGSKNSEEGQIFLNPQLWSVISCAAEDEQARKIMEKVNERLATPYGLKICDPPYSKGDYSIVRAQLMNPGLKENGGIFIHTQGWGVIAETMLGHGNRAYEYLRAYLPAAYNTKAEIREIEPYVVCQSTHTSYSPKHGASRVPWLSGSATWTYYAITHYILGIRPEYNGITIDPCIPDKWKNLSVHRHFRGKDLKIEIINNSGVQKGVKRITLNSETIEGSFISIDQLKENNKIEIEM